VSQWPGSLLVNILSNTFPVKTNKAQSTFIMSDSWDYGDYDRLPARRTAPRDSGFTESQLRDYDATKQQNYQDPQGRFEQGAQTRTSDYSSPPPGRDDRQRLAPSATFRAFSRPQTRDRQGHPGSNDPRNQLVPYGLSQPGGIREASETPRSSANNTMTAQTGLQQRPPPDREPRQRRDPEAGIRWFESQTAESRRELSGYWQRNPWGSKDGEKPWFDKDGRPLSGGEPAS
jgi:hypothetical protein